MGFFSNLPDVGNKIAQPIYRKIPQAYDAIAKQINRAGNGTVNAFNAALAGIDVCNIYVTTDAGILFIRNPYCSNGIEPQIPTPEPPLGQFAIPPNGCTQTVGFSFTESNGKLISGADKFGYLVDGGKTPIPAGTLQTGGGLDNIYTPSFTTFLYDSELHYPSSIVVRYLQLDGIAYAIYSTALTFDNIQLKSANGIVEPAFPLYRFNNQYIFAPWQVSNIDTGTCIPIPPTYPPPPPKKKECKCMCCDNQQNNNSLLKLLLQRIGNLPANVPDNFASKAPKQITLNSLAELGIWQAQQMDALAGQYPIPLTIKADPTDSNSKDQHLELPNQAEALAEILGLLVTTKRDTHATLVGIIKVLAESGMIKNLATQTYDVTHANAEFLGYKLEQVKRTIPSTFTPNGKNLAETFKETNIDITSYENKDSTDLQDDLKKLLQMAARWNAQNWRTIGANAAVSLSQIFLGNVDTVQNTHEAIKQETFADFLKEVEQGFTHAEGVTDANDPWGNPANEAPTVRQIGITAESAAEAQQQVATSNALTGRSDSVTKDVAVQTAITKIANTLKAL